MLRPLLLSALLGLISLPAVASEVYVVVDISDQVMNVRMDGELVHSFTVSTGRKGYSTPPGAYGVERMHKKYFSQKYDNAPMPYAIFFHGGYAIHGTTDIKRLGQIASHGCVRLHPENARELYALVKEVGADKTHVWVKQ
jgi:lipoprotein-anchoring transpeptidase ErfK/SrfK